MPFISAGDGDLKSAFITDAWLIDQFVGNRLFAWGNNGNGQLGDNTRTHRSYPIQTIAGGTNWRQVSCGGNNLVGVKTDGTLWTWGSNYNGRLGDNTTVDKSSPVQVVGFATNWSSVSCGYSHTVAIKTDGTLWAWGRNYNGQLGDNTTVDKSSPVQTVTGGNNWRQVAGGAYHTVAIKTDGTLWAWGRNYNGRLGDNTTTNRSSPVQTVTGGNNWRQVAGGAYHTAAIKTDGTLWIWGYNGYGRLGDNTTTDRSSPVQTVTGGTNWKQVACGYSHTVAVKSDGTFWAWGYNYNGRLGDNTTTDRSSPVQTVTGGTNWKQVACGYSHTVAVKSDGTVWTWGANFYGQLGDNTTTERSSPVQTVTRGTNWKQVACGNLQTAAVTYGD